jgi:hypothetical protein
MLLISRKKKDIDPLLTTQPCVTIPRRHSKKLFLMAVHSLGTLYSLSTWRHSLADSPSFRTQSDLRMHSANSARISLQLDGIVKRESCVMQKKRDACPRRISVYSVPWTRETGVTVKSKMVGC